MTRRTRIKPGSWENYTSNATNAKFNVFKGVSNHQIMVDSKKRPCNLSVEIEYPLEDVVFAVNASGDSSHAVGLQGCHNWPVNASSTWQTCVAPYLFRLKHKKLATSNQADLLTAFAELDDSIAMLGKKFASSISYGGIKWGWMPLISDIMAANDAANSVKNSILDGNTRTNKYNTGNGFIKKSQWFKYNYHGGLFECRHVWDVQVKFKGQVSYENDVLAFYDYMGFHPSPKVIWDLVPFSFAIDYILPIGDMLKQLSPSKGWVKSANFTGWQVVTAFLTVEFKDVSNGPWKALTFSTCTTKAKYVTRTYCNGVSLHEKPIPKTIDVIKMPEIEQVFDIAYLAEAFYSHSKRILSPHVYRKRKR